MDAFFTVYIFCWTVTCLIAAFLYFRDRSAYAISHVGYWRFLFMRWKVMTFLTAAAGMTIIAPYSGDPTWDYFDAIFMSVLAFATAPWAMGAVYKVVRKELPLRQGFVAVCVLMFSASWSYDLYILIRDGEYPITWFANIFASSVLYILAGLLWNLEYRKGRGMVFSFMERDWPDGAADADFPKILALALPIMILVAVLILYFFWFKL
jgi:hypothetical protein